MLKFVMQTPQELKGQYRSVSVLGDKRIVFNIAGNKHRLIVDIEFQLQFIFIVWIATHVEYDLIDTRLKNRTVVPADATQNATTSPNHDH
ncbi:MAG TPA: type II toxin-antitoxin system HigB family toxin [Saprospiraceae bacterium]|nr:type II toxin-antitoxin system HigB family toxin [Saprospiraceae bacterium]